MQVLLRGLLPPRTLLQTLALRRQKYLARLWPLWGTLLQTLALQCLAAKPVHPVPAGRHALNKHYSIRLKIRRALVAQGV